MTIRNITVENVKGIENKSLDLDVLPNRPSLLVAPNGFGKSSIAVAFLSMNSNRLALHEDHLHHGDSTRTPRLSLTYIGTDGTSHSLEANPTSNTIANHFDYFVINNQTKAKGIGRNIGGRSGGRTLVSASLMIEPVVLVKTIPERTQFDYSYSNQKALFGLNGKVLPNIRAYFQNPNFIESVSANFGVLDRALGIRVSKEVDSFVQAVNAQTGNAATLREWITENQLLTLEAIAQLVPIVDLIENSSLGVTSRTYAHLASLQIVRTYGADKKKFKKACRFSNFRFEKSKYRDLLSAFNSSSREITPREKQGKLIVEFPKAHLISNGERDVLSFISLLHRARRKLKKDYCILIIDEIFDYLDDANLAAVQYYTTQLIDEYKQLGKVIYPLILTHLNPYYFKNFIFSKQKEYYLDKTSIVPNQHMVRLLRNREHNTIERDVSKHLLHFSPSTINKRSEFRALGLKETWGEHDNFEQYTNQELQKYVSKLDPYDPLAICCAVRRKIERNVYEALTTSEHRSQFLSTNMTRKKLAYAESVGVVVPEYYYLLGVIYNDGMHWRENRDNISPIAAKLENLTIRHMIRQLP